MSRVLIARLNHTTKLVVVTRTWCLANHVMQEILQEHCMALAINSPWLSYAVPLSLLRLCTALPLVRWFPGHRLCALITTHSQKPMHIHFPAFAFNHSRRPSKMKHLPHLSGDEVINVAFGLAAIFLTIYMIWQAAKYAARGDFNHHTGTCSPRMRDAGECHR